ncbi:MAG: hypothetical protein MJ193_04905, partial [Clostridia bacterium]|nr:hypothetical protein [Clostridia bacterium]
MLESALNSKNIGAQDVIGILGWFTPAPTGYEILCTQKDKYSYAFQKQDTSSNPSLTTTKIAAGWSSTGAHLSQNYNHANIKHDAFLVDTPDMCESWQRRPLLINFYLDDSYRLKNIDDDNPDVNVYWISEADYLSWFGSETRQSDASYTRKLPTSMQEVEAINAAAKDAAM